VVVANGNNTINVGDGATNSVSAGTGNNTVTGGTGADTIGVGKGINTITTGTGADVVTVTGMVAAGDLYSTITDAHATMKLTFNQANGTATFTTAAITLGGTAVFSGFEDAAAAGFASATNSVLSWFQFGGNTYIVQDNSNLATYQPGADTVVKLTGLFDLSGATFAAVAGTSASLTLV
jgi:S-layer protein